MDTRTVSRLLLSWQRDIRNAMGLALNGPRNIIAPTSQSGGYDGGSTSAGFI